MQASATESNQTPAAAWSMCLVYEAKHLNFILKNKSARLIHIS